MLTLKEWLKINHRDHKKSVALVGDKVRVVLYGGYGIDERLVGMADEEDEATRIALEVRERMAAVLP